MGSSLSILNKNRRKSVSFWSETEKLDIERGQSNQRLAAEFAVHLFYAVPTTNTKESEDPLSVLWIRVDENKIREYGNLSIKKFDEKILQTVPTLVMVQALDGRIRACFPSGVRYEFYVHDIRRADAHEVAVPKPPVLGDAQTRSLLLQWTCLPHPVGIVQKVDVQYATTLLPLPLVKDLVGSSNDASPDCWVWQALVSKSYECKSFSEHLMEGLNPGENFVFRLRYWIPRGWSSWSTQVSYRTKADTPGTPAAPVCALLMPTSVRVCWGRPLGNGREVSEFILMGRGVGGSNDTTELYRGPCLSRVITNLLPESAYSFEVAAVNAVGISQFSPPMSLHTPARGIPALTPVVLEDCDCTEQAWVERMGPDGQLCFFNLISGARRTQRPGAAPCDDADALAAEKAFRVKRFRLLRALLKDQGDRSPAKPLVLEVRRHALLDDSMQKLGSVAVTKLLGDGGRRQRTRVTFVGEAGIDAGGPAREYFQLASKAVLRDGLASGWLCSTSRGSVFLTASGADCGPTEAKAPRKVKGEIVASKLRFGPARYTALLGRLCGLALLDRQLVDLPIAEAWAQQIVSGSGSAGLEHMAELQADLAQSLQWMLSNTVTGRRLR